MVGRGCRWGVDLEGWDFMNLMIGMGMWGYWDGMMVRCWLGIPFPLFFSGLERLW